MKDNNSKQVLLSVLGVAILVVAVVGVSFAAFSYSKTGEKVNTITTGTITMSYAEDTNAIELTDALPMTDDAGKVLTGDKKVFDFTVSANIVGTATINYAITATKEADSTLPDAGVKVYLTDTSDVADTTFGATPKKISELTTTSTDESQAPDGQFILKKGTYSSADGANFSDNYRLRMWVASDYNAPETSQTYKLRVNVYGSAAAQ